MSKDSIGRRKKSVKARVTVRTIPSKAVANAAPKVAREGARSPRAKAPAVGVMVSRRYTTAAIDPLNAVTYASRDSAINNTDGSKVFAARGIEVPEGWSQLATDIVVSKYFRKSGIDGDASQGERSVKQVVYRVAHSIREAGEARGYFADKPAAEVFEAELSHMLVNQYGAFNSPVWFNAGLFQRYGIKGSGGSWAWDEASQKVAETQNAYERPQCSACMPYEVRVNTSEGLVPIGEIVERFRVEPKTQMSTWDREGAPTRIVAAICNGKRFVMEYQLEDGSSLRMTSDHVVFAQDKDGVVREKQAGDVMVGEESLLLSRRSLLPESLEVAVGAFRVTRDMAWIAGMMVGDGFCGHPASASSDTWELKVNDIAARERVQVMMEAHGLPWTTTDFHWGHSIRGYGPGGRAFWERLGLWNKTGAKEIPSWVFGAGQDLVGAFLQGLFDADGTVIQHGKGRVTVQLSNTSRQVVEGSRSLLRALGVFTTTREFEDPREDYSRKDMLYLTANDVQSVERFAVLVNFSHLGKKAELEARSPDTEAANRKDSVLVTGRHKLGARWVYDIQTEAGVFWADGVLVHNCFIQSVNDDLMSIFDLLKNEARLFKYGSGTGSNFSALRGRQEKLSGGGTSSGLMSFLEVFDRAAGSTKSGGTTRRAAKMVCLDMDHPEIVDFIEWKSKEEKKAHALIAHGYPSDFNGEAYHTISGQNSNNSIRVTDDFMRAVESGGTWQTRMRTTGKPVDELDAKGLWRKVAKAAWACADPGIQYDTTINEWHTSPNSGRIHASNPCSEYMFLDDTACNLSSLNLTKFLRESPTGELDFDVEGYRHAARVFFIAQEILVDYSSYPTDRIAKNSHDYRPLGLGYANLGTLLMLMGVGYDSDQGRGIAAALTAILTGHAYRVSAEMAMVKGPFAGFVKNRDPMLKVMNKHRAAAYAIDPDTCPSALLRAAQEDWDYAVRLGEEHGYRNSQATVLAPTGTIGLLMDCDTTGIEPDFALVKFKKLAGGGYFKIVNASVERALGRLGYTRGQVAEVLAYVSGTNTFLGAPHLTREFIKARGLNTSDIERIEAALPGAFGLEQAFSAHVLGPEAVKLLGLEDEIRSPGFSLLTRWGLTNDQIDAATDHIIGRMTVEGAPHLRPEHLSVFDCANRCGKHGQRYIAPMAHVKMMAATQPFLSGAISKTVNLPNEATVEEIEEIYTESWRLGLKAVALYRDGCKASQPLSTTSEKKDSHVEAPKPEVKLEVKAVEVKVDSSRMSVQTGSDAAAEYGPLFSKNPVLSPERATVRHRLPKKRRGFTQEATIAGHKVFLRTGEYEDGQLGEIFIDMHKEGAAFRSMMNSFAIAVSLGLQHGVPLTEFVDQFTFTRFEPQGAVQGHANVKFATSIVDYVFRVLGIEYQDRYDLAHVVPEKVSTVEMNYSQMLTSTQPPAALSATTIGASEENSPDRQFGKMMGDAPFCDNCGHITVRNGSCYRCLNCGSSMGCS